MILKGKTFSKLIFVLFLLSSVLIFAQNNQTNAKCSDPHYQQFDFWVGKWKVYNTQGKLVGKNEIRKKYNNCLVQEKWQSEGKHSGTSYNFYNKSDGFWHQIWVDNTGFILNLKGHFKNGAMVLESNLIKNKKGNYFNRITWIKNEKTRTVTQIWETFNAKNVKIATLFKGIYKKQVN
ncbi:MAG: hypothetical protein ACWA42_05395 [Lutibacter sp.]